MPTIALKSAAQKLSPVFGLLGVSFIVMKLAHVGDVADWSWWWVTAPFWGGPALLLAFVFLVFWGAFVGLGIQELFKKLTPNRKAKKEVKALRKLNRGTW